MCGIAGIISMAPGGPLPEGTPSAVKAMTDGMRLRGPDGEGLLLEEGACLGHRRLSIIDLKGGAQPMKDGSGTLAITFNGEIYNFLEIQKELEGLGAKFQSKSDTEVILQAYKIWGPDCLEKFEGMFAFALWDAKEKRLFCARDRFGKKPFFYTVQNGTFVFASELSCMVDVPEIRLTLSKKSVMRYLAYQYVPCPDTMFQEVLQLPPSHFLLLEDGTVKISRYWDLPCASDDLKIGEEEACRRLRELMTRAVARRMRSDVPLGIFLSGGIDSSIVAGIMSGLSDKPVDTFSIGFKEASYDESGYARCVAEAFSTRHHERILSADECCDILPSLVSRMDVPMADASAAPTWLLSKVTRESVTVALGGDGADEMWAGYEHYIGFALAEKYNRLPQFLRKKIIEPLCGLLPASSGYVNLRLATSSFFKSAASPDWSRIQWMLMALSPEMQEEALLRPDKDMLREEELLRPTMLHFRHWKEGTPFERAFHVYAREFMLDDILVKVDRCSMLNSLEVRAPFLDRDVAEFVARLPAKFKLRGFKRKYLLKKAFSSMLPPRILNRNKRGFQIPVAQWLRGRMRPLMEETLGAGELGKTGLFSVQAVRKLMDAHLDGSQDLRVALWTLMVFQLWHKALREKRGQIHIG